MTSIPGLFAGGDIVRGGATLIFAMGAERNVVSGMQAYVQSEVFG